MVVRPHARHRRRVPPALGRQPYIAIGRTRDFGYSPRGPRQQVSGYWCGDHQTDFDRGCACHRGWHRLADDLPLSGNYTQNVVCKGDGTDPVAVRGSRSRPRRSSPISAPARFLDTTREGRHFAVRVECKFASGPLMGQLELHPEARSHHRLCRPRRQLQGGAASLPELAVRLLFTGAPCYR